MKKLKVTVGKNAPVRSFASLPEEQKDLQRFRKIKAMMCPCCGETMLLVDNVWPGFLTLSGAWKCVACGFANDVSKDNIID